MNSKVLAVLLTSTILLSGCTSATNWERVDADEFAELIDNNPEAFILDARTSGEWSDDGHLSGAVLIPHDTVKDSEGDLPSDKDELILVYCRSGSRSQTAAQSLLDLGYTNVIDLETGINGWKSAGYEVVYE